jgi:hypothetical protein
LGAHQATSYHSSGGAVSHAGLQTGLQTENVLTVIYRQMFKAHTFVARKLINPHKHTIHSLQYTYIISNISNRIKDCFNKILSG